MHGDEPPIQRPLIMAQFEHDGLALTYDDIGGGDCIVLVHGFASNRTENWRRVGWYGAIERKRMRLLALDVRGHGESAKPHDAAQYKSEALASDVIALMDHAGVGRAHILGYSMGARIALATALAHPDRVSHLIIGGIGGKLFDPPRDGHLLSDAMLAEIPDTISEPLLKSFRHFADEQGEDRKALAACAEGLDFRFTPDSVSAVRAPTLVVAGARDSLAGSAEDLAAAIPGARAVTLPGCDHFSAIPHALFKASVFDFLDGDL
jgi:pimeloyl-ACP methyl ester carboxylesterase